MDRPKRLHSDNLHAQLKAAKPFFEPGSLIFKWVEMLCFCGVQRLFACFTAS